MKTRVKRNNLIQKNELDSNGSIDKSPPPPSTTDIPDSWEITPL
jgi:hypothetical protein